MLLLFWVIGEKNEYIGKYYDVDGFEVYRSSGGARGETLEYTGIMITLGDFHVTEDAHDRVVPMLSVPPEFVECFI